MMDQMLESVLSFVMALVRVSCDGFEVGMCDRSCMISRDGLDVKFHGGSYHGFLDGSCN